MQPASAETPPADSMIWQEVSDPLTHKTDELSWLSHSSCLLLAVHLSLQYTHVYKEVNQKEAM